MAQQSAGGDIFDQVDSSPAASSSQASGDIFDQVSSQPVQAAPKAPVNPYANAPSGTATPSQPAPASVSAAPEPGILQRAENAFEGSVPGQNLRLAGQYARNTFQQLKNLYHPVEAAKEIGQGVGNLVGGLGPSTTGELPGPAPIVNPTPQHAQQVEEAGHAPHSNNQLARGATQIMQGGMEETKPLLPLAIGAAPFRAAVGYGAGILAGHAAKDVAARMGATPDEQQFFQTLGYFIPDATLKAAGVKGAINPEVSHTINPATGEEEVVNLRGGVVGGKGFAAGVAKGEPGQYQGALRVGPYSVRVNIGGGRFGVDMGKHTPGQPLFGAPEAPGPAAPAAPPPPPDPVSTLVSEQVASVKAAAERAADTESKAEGIAAGVPPPPPPSIPKPAGMDDGALTQDTISALAGTIRLLPTEQQAPAVLEATGNLAKWLFDKKTVVGPDGKVLTVDSPQSAQKAAVKIVNDEVERQNQTELQAKQEQEQQAQQAQQDAETARTEREESLEPKKKGETAPKVDIPNTPQVQRARSLLAALPDDATAAKMDQHLRDNILLPTPIRKALVEQEVSSRAKRTETAAQEAMTGKLTPEGQKPEEIDRWIQGVKDGEVPFAHIQKETAYRPQNVEGLSRTKVEGAKDASGIYYHTPDISGADIRKGAREGTLDQLTENWKKGKETAPAEAESGGAPAEAKPEEEQPKPQEEEAALTPYEGIEGKHGQLHLADETSIPVVHRIVERSALTASHNGNTFQPISRYPQYIQERRYESNKAEQMKVIGQEQDFKPELIVNTDPTALNGPLVVTSKPVEIDGIKYPAGLVLGANSRKMTLDRLYTNGAAAPYLAELQANHRSFGFPPEFLEDYREPVHVREIEPPKTLEEMHRLGSLLNKGLTQSLDPFDQAVSMAKHLSPDTLSGIADAIRAASDEDKTATLNSVLTDSRTGRQIVKMLESDGIITDRNRTSFVDPATALLTAPARSNLSNALLANLLDSRDLMEKTPAFLKQRLLGAIGSISAITSHDDGWNLGPALREAAKQYGELHRQTGMSPTEALKQQGMFGEQRGPVVEALIKALDKNVSEVRKSLSLFSIGAEEGRNPHGRLVGLSETPDPYLDFNFAFGTELTKEQFDSEMAKLRDKSEAPVEGITQTAPATAEQSAWEKVKAFMESDAKDKSLYGLRTHGDFANISYPELKRLHERWMEEKAASIAPANEAEGGAQETEQPAAEPVKTDIFDAEPRKLTKGDKVKYRTNKGKIRDAEVAYVSPDGTKVRIKDGKYDFWKPAADVFPAGEEAKPAPAEQTAEQPAAAEQPKKSLIQFLKDDIADGGGPTNYNELKYLARKFDGQEPDQLRMKQVQEAYEAALVDRAAEIADNAIFGAKGVFDSLVRQYEGQPNLAIRTSTSITNQAYSTPAPLAFVAGKFAGLKPGRETSVYEPTAGNGMLTIAAGDSPAVRAKMAVNELNGERCENLRELGFKPTTNDATKWAPTEKVDSVVTNPPFGALPGPVDFDGYKIVKLEHLIALKALSVMKDDGRACIIIGASKEPGEVTAQTKPFFNYLYSRYNVVSDFELDGDLYSRQGASWPVRVIAIDGRVRSTKVCPPASEIDRVTTWEGVYDKASEYLGANLEAERRANAEPVGQVREGSSEPGAISGASGNGHQLTHLGESEASPAGSENGEPGGLPGPLQHTGGVPTFGVGDADNVVASDGDVAQSDRLAEDEPRERAVRRGSPKPAGDSGNAALVSEEGNQFQEPYTPFSEKKDTNVLAPKAMGYAMHRAMERLSEAVGDLDQFVADELGYSDVETMQDAFMGLQVDTIAAGIHAIRRGKAIIIADQTGIGKGRQAAAIIRWAELHGHIPIFVTAKAQLFTDMYGDLTDIGSGDTINPLLMNADATITHPVTEQKVFGNKGGMTPVFQRIQETGELPAGRNAVFLTYSQVNKANRQQLVLSRLAPKAVFILDESHSAGGDSNTGHFFRGLLDRSKGAVYLSATYAKRPDNMPLYANKTDIGIAITDKDKIVSAIMAGGAPLQAVVSNQLAQSGQLFRRERSFKGIDFPTIVATERKAEHEKISDAVTEVLRAIVHADHLYHEIDFKDIQDEMEEMGMTAREGGNQASRTVNHMEFTSVVHNLVKQLLLGLKADDTADKIIQDIKDDKKPLVALENTMGSFLGHYAEVNGLLPGAPLHDFTYGTVLQRALDRTRYYNLTTEEGLKVRVEVPIEKLSEPVRNAYDMATGLIRRLRVDMPVSPIDWIRHRVEQAGFKIAEITGRDLRVDYSTDVPTLARVPAVEKRDRVATALGFNNGGIDAIILNQAGSTGISLHASQKFRDQRTRKMYVVQPAADVNQFMQMLGRINRTGQVRLPEYALFAVDLPAETRPAMNLSKKMKSLNANTTSNTRSAVSVESPDMMNKYGDKVVQQYLAENHELAKALGMSAQDGGEEEDEAGEDMARKATGRSALLSVKDQREFMDAITEQYRDLITYLDETGQNDLEPKTYDFDAREVRKEMIYQGTDPSSPFGEDAHFGVYSIKRQGKPFSPEEVMEQVKEGLHGAADDMDRYRKLNAELDRGYEAFRAKHAETPSILERAAQARQGTQAFMATHRIGAGARLEINGESYTAVVTNIEPAKKVGGNPYALSSIKYTLAVNGPMRSVRLSGTELRKILVMPLGARANVRKMFEEINPDARMRANIITGNLLGAYGALKGVKGRIINFTMQDGTTQQGILMPAKFDPKEHVTKEYAMRSAEGAYRTVQAYTGNGPALMAPDGDVTVTRGYNGGITIKTKMGKSAGGKFFLDKELLNLVDGGEFASRGGMMAADVVPANAAKALNIVMQKAALYATSSMIQQARDFDERVKNEKRQPEPPKPTGGKVRQALASEEGFADMQAAADYAAKAVPATWNELVKFVGASNKTARKIGREIAAGLMPTSLADSKALDIMGHATGEPALRLFESSQLLRGVQKMFENMTPEQQVEFVDRWQTGRKQPSTDLHNAQELMRSILEAQRGREVEAVNLGRDEDDRIELTQKENYFPNRYKTPPGDELLPTDEERVARIGGVSRRPFAGSKAFLKKQHYTLKEAVEKNAVPLGTPVEMLLRRMQEGAKFVASQYYMHNRRQMKRVKFLRNGKKMPAGFVDIQDNIAKVWRPVETDEEGTIFVQAGKWIGKEDDLRLLNNYLSADHLRGSEVGTALIKLKTMSTEMRLALSPFHFAYITVENFASGLNAGLDKFYNQGIRNADAAKIRDGLAEIGKSVISPYTAVRVGGSMLKYSQNPDQFLESPEGQRFAQLYPDFPHLQDLLFRGGLRWGMADTYRQSFGDGFVDAMKAGELGKGFVKSIPWISHTLMKPLFEHYIPRSKWAFAVQMLSTKLAQYSQAIAAGTITEETIAREVAATTDNRFGELNWDSLYLNNTLRTAAQLAFRSATWKLGSWRGAVSATRETFSSKAFDDRIFDRIDDEETKYQWLRDKTRRLPQLGMNAGWILSMGITVAVMGSVISMLASGKWPWEWAEDDSKKNQLPQFANSAFEAMHPRSGHVNMHGQPIRVSFPTGLKDYEHGLLHPGSYIKGSLSDVLANAWDTLENRDAFGNYVYNPNDPITKEFMQGFVYNLRGDWMPMSAENYSRQYGPQDAGSRVARATGMMGGAPKFLDHSAALTKALSEVHHEAHTPEQEEAYRLAQHQPPTRAQVLKAARERNLTYLDKVVLHDLTYQQAKDIYDNYASPEEKSQLRPIIERKRTLAILKARSMHRF